MSSNLTLADLDRQQSIHGYTNLRQHETLGPLIITRGEGVYVFDSAGRRYLEGMSGLWCASLGFSDERLVTAATRQLQSLPFYHGFSHKATDIAIELTSDLLAIAPASMARVFFGNSGSDANDTAVKIVRYYNNALGRSKKKKIIARMKGYHGVTMMTASLTGLPHLHQGFDLPLDGVLHTACPHHWRYAEPGESEEAYSQRLASSLDALITREGPDTVAAFIAEPVMGAGGVIVPPRGYFERIQEVLRKHDVLLIADEVICGFGRTGEMFGSQTFGMEPDIMVCAKALSAAYVPISATMITAPIYEAIADQSQQIGVFGHGYTYSAHPVGAAVAREALRIYGEMDVAARVRELSPRLLDGLRRLGSDSPIVGEVRGVGLIAAMEFAVDPPSRQAFPPEAGVAAHFTKCAQYQGLVVRALGDAVAVCPPLSITPAEIDELLTKFAAALHDTERHSRAWR